MSTLTSRQRVLLTLQHQEPDRPPIDVGGGLCSISQFSYRKLLARLGWDEEVVIGGMLTQVVRPSQRMLERLGSDFAHIFAGSPDVKLGRDLEGSPNQPFETYSSGVKQHTFMDEWGMVWRRAAYYYDMVDFPLKEASSMADLNGYLWPDPKDPGRFRHLAEQAKEARAGRQVAVTLDPLAGGILEMASSLRGHQNFYTDLAANPEFAEELLERITQFFEDFYEGAMKAAGPYIDIVFFGDDYGMQNSMIISPAMWRRMIKPYLARLIKKIKSLADVRFQLHSCGAISPIIGDLVEIGVDILNPIQPSATGMEPAQIKSKFGDRLVLHGAIDQQNTMPHGTPDDVRREVEARLRDLAPGGGYILAVSPNIQADVAPDNILALYDTAQRAGRCHIQPNA